MKITFPNGTILEATVDELAEVSRGMDNADKILRTAFGDDSLSVWETIKTVLGLSGPGLGSPC